MESTAGRPALPPRSGGRGSRRTRRSRGWWAGTGQPIKPKPTDLVQLLEGLGSILSRLIGEQVDFELDLQSGPITVEADPSQIEQLIVNLSVNARDAMPDGGRLVVALNRRRHDQSNLQPRVPTGEYAVIRVSDTGEGMEQEQLDQAFDPFFTTKGPGGLGLATVRAIAEQGGGGVFIESKPGAGTSVHVLLPLSSGRPVSREGQSQQPTSLDGVETILLAKDEDRVRRLVRRVLQQRGYRVIPASDGAEALELARKPGMAIDLVITDAVMPRLSGIQLAKQLRVMRPGLKILFMSGYAHGGSFTAASLGEQSEILEKPFSPDVLLKAVRELLDRD